MNYYITSDNTKIYYNLQGHGKPIIFIHGYAASMGVFRIPQKILSKEYLALSCDLRGHGMSRVSMVEVNLDILAGDLYELLTHLKLTDVTVVGWSMGGSVIFEYISKYGCKNIDSIVLVDTGPKVINTKDWRLGLYNGEYNEKYAKSDLNKMMNSWDDFSKNFMSKMAPFLDDKQLEVAIKSMADNEYMHMKRIWKDLVSKDYRNILEEISVPTMIIMGGKSNLYSRATGEYLKENIKNSNLLIFAECGHLLVQENPTGFSRAIKNFML